MPNVALSGRRMTEDPSASGPPADSGSVGSPPRPPSDPSARTAGLVAIAMVVVLVLSLLLLGEFGGGSGLVTFSAAEGAAASMTGAVGAWELVSATGLDLANATWTGPIDFSGTNCAVSSPLGAVPSNISFPAFQGDLLSGGALEWEFAFLDHAANALMLLYTTGGSETAAIVLSGANCLGVVTVGQTVPSPVVDSPVVVSAAVAAGGAAFLSDYPRGVSLEMTLFVPMPPEHLGSAQFPAVWIVMFTTCPPLSSYGYPGQGYQFTVDVNATTGIAIPGSAATMGCTQNPDQSGEMGTPSPIVMGSSRAGAVPASPAFE